MATAEKRVRVLVVDDDEAVLRAFLRAFGARYEVVGVPSGEAALEALHREPFDLAVLDFQMPGMNGAELARRIEAELPSLPRIMLTGYAGLQEIIDLEDASLVSAVLMKPWETADVERAIDQAVAQAARRAERP